jgi:hypothetical protein
MRRIDRLNQILRVWEDACFLARAGGTAQSELGLEPLVPLDGPIIHFNELRPHMLRALNVDFDEERFIGLPINQKKFQDYLNLLYTVPVNLFLWNKHSRRVFHIEEELQVLLDATSLERMTWNDIRMPFSTFAITLSRPIEDAGAAYDCILVTSYETREKMDGLIEVRILTSMLDGYQPVLRSVKKAIERAQHIQDWQRMLDSVNSAYTLHRESSRRKRGSVFVIDMHQGDRLVLDSLLDMQKKGGIRGVENLPSDGIPEWDAAARIVMGMCLYLQTIPSKSPHRTDWTPLDRPKHPDPRSITEGALICTISSSYKMKREERQILGLDDKDERLKLTASEVRAHFRMGHWRRAPGSGNDPNAPKIVHVRPTIVRRDRLSEGALPGGTEAVL